MSDLLPALNNLMKDNEAEVRMQACSRLTDFCNNLPTANRQQLIVTNFLPTVKELAQDTNSHVKTALASQVHRLLMSFAHFLPAGNGSGTDTRTRGDRRASTAAVSDSAQG